MFYKPSSLWKEGKMIFCMILPKMYIDFFWQKSCRLSVTPLALCNAASQCPPRLMDVQPTVELRSPHTRFLASVGLQQLFPKTLEDLSNTDSLQLQNLPYWKDIYNIDSTNLSTRIPRSVFCLQKDFWWLYENVCVLDFSSHFLPWNKFLSFCHLQFLWF